MQSCSIFLFVFSVLATWPSTGSNMFLIRNLMPRTIGANTNLLESIASSVQAAMAQCSNTFRWDRWNCPESAFAKLHKQPATKEQAVTHAVLSAGLVHGIARNCSRGELKGCGCSKSFRGRFPVSSRHISRSMDQAPKAVDWSWGGCSDDVEYAQLTTERVLDVLERGKDPQAYVNLHNNLVGRKAVRNSMIKKCRCHGVSGSCSLQTCWMQVAPFAHVSTILRQRYKKAVKIHLENRGNTFTIHGPSSVVEIAAEDISQISDKQLVFLEESPNYCFGNNTIGWPGTKGRMCSRSRLHNTSPAERRSCRNLCKKCGYKVRKHKKQVTSKCNCTFKWCCEVKCDTCTKTVEEFFCE